MKKIIAMGVIGMFLLTSFSVFVVAERQTCSRQITLSYSFETPVIEKIEIGDDVYDRVNMSDAPCGGNPGEPRLPGKGAYILLPQGTKVNEIKVTPGERVCLGSSYLVEPVGEGVPLSYNGSVPLPKPDEEIYSSSDIFPEKLYSRIGTYSFRGANILVLKLHPVQYIPTSGELFYYSDLTISVNTIEDGDVNPLYRGLERDKDEFSKKVDNSDVVTTYTQIGSGAGSTDEYDLVIITTDSLKDGFEPLKNAHEAEGVKTLIYTVEDVYSEYSGVDNADKIRNFIIDAYQNWGIEYVLLGGDDDVVPARHLSTSIIEGGWPGYLRIPSDHYYAALDGTWNNPENPNPADKDISINDAGVSISTEGYLSGPMENYTDYITGGSSMLWTVTTTDNKSAVITFTFDPPLDISSAQWFNFHAKTFRQYSCYFNNIIFHDVDGSEIRVKEWSRYFPTSWELHPIQIPKSDVFNYNAVDSISIVVKGKESTQIGDTILIDQVYLSDWLDDYFGEPSEEDLYAEVYIGRACVGNAAEVNNFVGKTMAYMSTDSDDNYLKKVLMVGENLGGAMDPSDWGGIHMDELIVGSIKHGYITVGIPRLKYRIRKLYDILRPPPGWSGYELATRINDNIHIINHLGHSDYDYNMKMYNSDVDALTNDKYCFVYSQGCMAGGFDNPEGFDCIAEHFTVKNGHGAFAGIWNARYGVGALESTDGPSQRFHREFWDAVFGENITAISKANQDSKEDNIWRINEEEMHMVYYGLNLFGDPSPSVQFKNANSINNQNQNSQTHQQLNSQSNPTSSQQSTTSSSSSQLLQQMVKTTRTTTS